MGVMVVLVCLLMTGRRIALFLACCARLRGQIHGNDWTVVPRQYHDVDGKYMDHVKFLSRATMRTMLYSVGSSFEAVSRKPTTSAASLLVSSWRCLRL